MRQICHYFAFRHWWLSQQGSCQWFGGRFRSWGVLNVLWKRADNSLQQQMKKTQALSRILLVLALLAISQEYALEGSWRLMNHQDIKLDRSVEVEFQFAESIGANQTIVRSLVVHACYDLSYTYQVSENSIYLNFQGILALPRKCQGSEISLIRSKIETVFYFVINGTTLSLYDPTGFAPFVFSNNNAEVGPAINGGWQTLTVNQNNQYENIYLNGSHAFLCGGNGIAIYNVTSRSQIIFTIMRSLGCSRDQIAVLSALDSTIFYRVLNDTYLYLYDYRLNNIFYAYYTSFVSYGQDLKVLTNINKPSAATTNNTNQTQENQSKNISKPPPLPAQAPPSPSPSPSPAVPLPSATAAAAATATATVNKTVAIAPTQPKTTANNGQNSQNLQTVNQALTENKTSASSASLSNPPIPSPLAQPTQTPPPPPPPAVNSQNSPPAPLPVEQPTSTTNQPQQNTNKEPEVKVTPPAPATTSVQAPTAPTTLLPSATITTSATNPPTETAPVLPPVASTPPATTIIPSTNSLSSSSVTTPAPATPIPINNASSSNSGDPVSPSPAAPPVRTVASATELVPISARLLDGKWYVSSIGAQGAANFKNYYFIVNSSAKRFIMYGGCNVQFFIYTLTNDSQVAFGAPTGTKKTCSPDKDPSITEPLFKKSLYLEATASTLTFYDAQLKVVAVLVNTSPS